MQTVPFICCVIWGKLFAFAILSFVHRQRNLDKALKQDVGLPVRIKSNYTDEAKDKATSFST